MLFIAEHLLIPGLLGLVAALCGLYLNRIITGGRLHRRLTCLKTQCAQRCIRFDDLDDKIVPYYNSVTEKTGSAYTDTEKTLRAVSYALEDIEYLICRGAFEQADTLLSVLDGSRRDLTPESFKKHLVEGIEPELLQAWRTAVDGMFECLEIELRRSKKVLDTVARASGRFRSTQGRLLKEVLVLGDCLRPRFEKA